MLTNREKRLLYLLMAVIVLGGSILFISFRLSDLEGVNNNIKSVETTMAQNSIENMDQEALREKLEVVKSALEEEKKKFYGPLEIDLDDFSRNVEDLAKKSALAYKTTQMGSNKEREYIDYRFQGTAYALASFLKKINEREKYWRIMDLSVKNNKFNNGKTMDIDIRISYETLGPKNN